MARPPKAQARVTKRSGQTNAMCLMLPMTSTIALSNTSGRTNLNLKLKLRNIVKREREREDEVRNELVYCNMQLSDVADAR